MLYSSCRSNSSVRHESILFFRFGLNINKLLIFSNSGWRKHSYYIPLFLHTTCSFHQLYCSYSSSYGCLASILGFGGYSPASSYKDKWPKTWVECRGTYNNMFRFYRPRKGKQAFSLSTNTHTHAAKPPLIQYFMISLIFSSIPPGRGRAL